MKNAQVEAQQSQSASNFHPWIWSWPMALDTWGPL